jgi:thiamine-phosphate pyrophosphorylase
LSALQGLYAITSAAVCRDDARLMMAVAAALRGGARLLQYRDKDASPSQRLRRAEALAVRCHQAGTRFIVNDEVALAAAVGADGVHVGRSDSAVAAARAALGDTALIGASCGDDLAYAREVIAAGASYVAFGRLFPSRTKPLAPATTLDTLTAAVASLPVPVCAIGGIGLAQLPAVLATGVRLVAAVDGVFGAADIEAAARAYAEGLATYNHGPRRKR